MTLWCEPCGETHAFTPTEAERLVYTLQAAAADAHQDTNGIDYGLCCLKTVLRYSTDSEMYGEHVSALIERRESADGGTKQ